MPRIASLPSSLVALARKPAHSAARWRLLTARRKHTLLRGGAGGGRGKSAPRRNEACSTVLDLALWHCASSQPVGGPELASEATGQQGHDCTAPPVSLVETPPSRYICERFWRV